MNAYASGNQTHECTKKNCAFCYEMHRITIPYRESYLPTKFSEKEKSTHVAYNEHRWTGCEILTIMPHLKEKVKDIVRFFPNRSFSAIGCKMTQWRKVFKIPSNVAALESRSLF